MLPIQASLGGAYYHLVGNLLSKMYSEAVHKFSFNIGKSDHFLLAANLSLKL